MHPEETHDRMDRHALVMAIWAAFGFATVVLINHGLGPGGPLFVDFHPEVSRDFHRELSRF
jgi:hypothetical protein